MSDSVLSCKNDLLSQPGFVIPLEERGRSCIPVDENCYSILRLRSDWQSWLEAREFVLFVTLTYDREVSEDAAKRDLQHFHRRLYSKLYDKSPGQVLSLIGFLELTKSYVPHWHILFERIKPKGGETLQHSIDRLRHLIKQTWLRMRNTPWSEAGFDSQLVDNQAPLIDYCLKSARIQYGFDFIEPQFLAPAAVTQPSLSA